MSFGDKQGERQRVKERKTNKKRDGSELHYSQMHFAFDLHNQMEELFNKLIDFLIN
jgi:hypothetical protein